MSKNKDVLYLDENTVDVRKLFPGTIEFKDDCIKIVPNKSAEVVVFKDTDKDTVLTFSPSTFSCECRLIDDRCTSSIYLRRIIKVIKSTDGNVYIIDKENIKRNLSRLNVKGKIRVH